MPTIVGILTFMSRINLVFSWVEHENIFFYKIESWSGSKQFDTDRVTERSFLNWSFNLKKISRSTACKELKGDKYQVSWTGSYNASVTCRKSQNHARTLSGGRIPPAPMKITPSSGNITGPPGKHHWNGVSLVGQWWPLRIFHNWISSPLCLLFWFDSLCPIQQFFSYVVMGLPGLSQCWARINVSCLNRHKAVTPVRLEPATPWSQDMHSTTELPFSTL